MIEQVRSAGRDRFLTNDGLQHQAERALQLAIQICIYVAVHLVVARGLRVPDEYRDVFERLSREDTLDAALAHYAGRDQGNDDAILIASPE